MKLLRDIVEIQIGYQNREKGRTIAKDIPGTHKFIQIKDIVNSQLNNENLFTVTPKGDAERYLVNKGDVLFLSRGQKGFAVSIPEPLRNTIAAYYFYILRLQSNAVLPEYLVWLINHPKSQAYLTGHQRGSHIKVIPKGAFEELPVWVPSLKEQRLIVGLEALRKNEEQLLNELISARKKLIDNLILKKTRTHQECA